MKSLVVLTVLFGVLAGCATSPTGRSQLMLVSPESAIVESKKALKLAGSTMRTLCPLRSR